MIAAIYSRKSKFTEKGESVENQIQMCKEYAVKLGVTDFIIYEDEGYSGKSIDRPDFLRLLKDAENNKFNLLICYKLDRISRNVADFTSLIKELEQYNISFISVRDQFDTSTPIGRAMMYISSVFAQLERETIAERIRDNMMELSKTGRWLGGNVPLGFFSEKAWYYDNNLNKKNMYKLTPIPDEIKLVKLIYDKYIKLGSIFKVVKYLNNNNIHLKKNYYADSVYISEILHNPVYATASKEVYDYFNKSGTLVFGEMDNIHGIMSYNRKRQGRYKNPESEWIIASAVHEGIIPGKVWVDVQHQHKKNRFLPPNLGNSSVSILSKLLFCDMCGSPMCIRYGVKRKNGTRPYYFTCSAHILNKYQCSNKSVSLILIESSVIDGLKKMTFDMNTIMSMLSNKYTFEKENLAEKELLNSEKLLLNNEALIRSLIVESPSLSTEAHKVLSARIEELNKENSKLKSFIQELKSQNKNSADISSYVNKICSNTLNFSDIFDNCKTQADKRYLINEIIEKVYWNGNTKEIKIKLRSC
ncbi:MAG: resolvase protein [Clostridiaceae bacterium]|jgi:site-specific DNA recombinase|nr:resolvase protein [Clostridiaceae bacterium]